MGNRRRQRDVVTAGRGAGSASGFAAREVFMMIDLVDNINTVSHQVDIVNHIT
jgi:hypothetical protein